jgi:hypothetical protein
LVHSSASSGSRRLGDAAVIFDVHRVASGEPKATLIDLAADVTNAVAVVTPCRQLGGRHSVAALRASTNRYARHWSVLEHMF